MEQKNKYDYSLSDKPKGEATVVPDEPLEVFPNENEKIDTLEQPLTD